MSLYNEAIIVTPKNYRCVSDSWEDADIQLTENNTGGYLAFTTKKDKDGYTDYLYSVRIYTVPYCCGILFFADVQTYYRYEGYGRAAVNSAIRAAELGGYPLLSGVVANDVNNINDGCSKRFFHLLRSMGFEITPLTKNTRSGNYLFSVTKVIDTTVSPLQYMQDPKHTLNVVRKTK